MTGRTRVSLRLRLEPMVKRKLEACAACAGLTVSDYVSRAIERVSEPTPREYGSTRTRLAEARRVAAGRRGA